VLIDRHHSNGIDGAGEATSLNSAKTNPKVLRHTRIDGDAAGGAPVEPVASSEYFGTSCMSMKGDLPGLSKCCCGFIGSNQ
jgi:hypothetical protein